MKQHIFTAALSLLISVSTLSQSCSTFYSFKEGTISEITTYDKKGKVAAVVNYTVIESNDNQATLRSTVSDKKGEEISATTYTMDCTADGISIDFKSIYNPMMQQQFSDMETTITGENIVYPNSLSIGQTLPDASIQIKVNMGGMNMNVAVNITERKVIDQEDITTPAGSFECYVIEYVSDVKMGVKQKGSAKQWIAKGVGLVKQEDYNKKGKVTSSSVLTAFSQ